MVSKSDDVLWLWLWRENQYRFTNDRPKPGTVSENETVPGSLFSSEQMNNKINYAFEKR